MQRHIISACRIILLCSTLVSSVPVFAWAREWKSADGKSKVEADFVALRSGKVVLEKKNGEIISVPLEKLSPEDIAYVEGRVDSAPKTDSPSSVQEMKKNEDAKQPPAPTSSDSPTPSSTTSTTEDWQYLKFTRPIKLRGEKYLSSSGVSRVISPARMADAFAFSPNGEFMAIAVASGAIAIYDVSSSFHISTTEKSESNQDVTAICFSADGKLLISGNATGKIEIWSVQKDGTLKWENEFPIHSSRVKNIAISHDNKIVISYGGDRNVRVWRLDDGGKVFTKHLDHEANEVWISPDGTKALVAGGPNVGLLHFDLVSKTTKNAKLPDDEPYDTVKISYDGSLIALHHSHTTKICDTTTGRTIFEKKVDDYLNPTGLLIDRNNQKLLIGIKNDMEVWDIPTKKKIETIRNVYNTYIRFIVLSPDNTHFAVGNGSAPINIVRFGLP